MNGGVIKIFPQQKYMFFFCNLNQNALSPPTTPLSSHHHSFLSILIQGILRVVSKRALHAPPYSKNVTDFNHI